MKKIEPQKKFSLIRRALRLLRADRTFEEPPKVQKEFHIGVPTIENYNYWKEIEAASLEAERRKAEALMERQKRRFIC